MAAVISETLARRADGRLGDLFQTHVTPHLAELERRRRQLRSGCFLAVAGVLVAIFAVLVLVRDLPTALFWSAGVAMAGLVVTRLIQRSYCDQVRKAVMPAICDAIGDLEHKVGSAPGIDLRALADAGLVPDHNRTSIDDVFTGRHRSTGFTMAEVRLHRHGGRRTRKVFKGLIFSIEVPKPVPARILFAKDGGLIGNGLQGWIRGFGGMEGVALADPAFEERFELYADRPEVARAIVTPELCERLVALADGHDGKRFQAAFVDGRFFLAMPCRGDQFRLGSLFRSTEMLEDQTAEVLREVQIVHRLIDYLHGDRPDLQAQPAARNKTAEQAAPDHDYGPGPVERC